MISIRFRTTPAANAAASPRQVREVQTGYAEVLSAIVARFVDAGVIERATVEPVFPSHRDPRLAAMFLVHVVGLLDGLVAALRRLPEVASAQVTPSREVKTGR
ncbi:MAG: hypothetical protein IT373_31180 [Polyangiaceae bacterium]|nr:hypothetical protein [Polyangiaceae bacterium]